MAAAERSTNAGFVGEEDEASRVDLYGALNVETTATSIEVRFCFFPLYFFFVKPMRHAREECIVFYVASPSRLFSATRAAGEMTRTASARAGGREERERERAKRRDFFVFLWTRIGNLKSRIENGRFFFKKKKKVLLVVFSNFTTGGRRCFDRAYLFRFLSFPLPEKIDSPSVPELNHKSAPG